MLSKIYISFIFTMNFLSSGIYTSPSPSIDALVQLMTLTVDTCGQIDWCTVKYENYTGTTQRGCCPHCSCDRDCASTLSCCPDFKLSNVIDGTVFSSVDDLIKELGETTFNDIDVYDSSSEETGNLGEHEDCIFSRLHAVTRNRPKSSLYVMVTKCANISVTHDVKAKCESPMTADSMNFDINDVIPVQSTSSGSIYRNKFCALCSHADDGPFTEWDIYIATTDSPLDFRYDLYYTMNDVIKFLTGRFSQNYDILFEPSQEMKEIHPPKVCRAFDVVSCRNEATTSQVTKDACEKFALPAFTDVDRQFTSFKNLACMSCNGLQLRGTFNLVCNRYDYWESLTPLVARLEHRYIIPKSGLHVSTKAPDLNTVFGLGCEPGYVYDSKRSICRKMYCPCGMVVFESKCVYIFQEIVFEKYYTVYIDIWLTTNQGRPNETVLQSSIFQHVKDAFENSDEFVAHHIVLLVTTGRIPNPKRYFAYIIYSGQNGHSFFPEAIGFVSSHFRGLKNVRQNGVQFKIKMAVTDNMSMIKRGTTDINTKYAYKIGFATSDVFALGYQATLVNRNQLRVSECNFCHRIELLEDEVEGNGPVVFIKKTSEIVRGLSYIESNGTGLVVCAGKVIPDIDVDKEATTVDKEATTRDTDDKLQVKVEDVGDATTIVMVSIIAFLVFVIFGTVFFKACFGRSKRSRENAGTVSTGDVEPRFQNSNANSAEF